jgi:O-antigen/teichoic acid export membrane protein
MVSDSLSKSVAKSAGFLTIQSFANKFLTIGRNVVLARLLVPEDFGLLSLSMVMIQGLSLLASLGVDRYLIQKPRLNDDIIANAWLLNIGRGILLSCIAFLFAPVFSNLVHEPKTLQVLQIIAIIPFLQGFKNPESILAERRMLFGRIALYEFICALSHLIIVIVLALFLRNVTALAWGMLLGAIIAAMLSLLFFPLPPFPKFNLVYQADIFSVVKHFIIISIGTLIMIQGDNLIIGAFLGTKLLGLYVIAYQLAIFPIGFLTQIANRVAFPVFSNLQVKKEQLRQAVVTVMRIQMAVIIPFVMIIFFFANDLITLLYGDKWLDAGHVLQALMFVTLGKGLIHVAVPYIHGTGQFGFASRLKSIETVIFLLSVYICTKHYGLIGASLAAGFVYMIGGIIRLLFLHQKSGIAFENILKNIVRPFIAVTPGLFIAMAVKHVMLTSLLLSGYRISITIMILLIATMSYIVLSFYVQKELIGVIKKIW